MPYMVGGVSDVRTCNHCHMLVTLPLFTLALQIQLYAIERLPFAMETAAILVHSLNSFHCAPKWPPWRLPSCCCAVTSYANAL